MSEHRNQHFVPKFYLRAFAGGAKHIAAFHLASGKVFPAASIRKQCQRPWLYGPDGRIEGLLSELEDVAAPVLRHMLRSLETPPKDSEEFQSLMGFLLVQSARTPQAAAVRIAMNDVAMRELVLRHPQWATPHELSELLRHQLRESPRETLAAALPSLPALLDLELRLLTNSTATEFITSDGPVSLSNTWAHIGPGRAATGFAHKGLQIALPMTPGLLLLAYDRSTYRLPGHRTSPLAIRDDAVVAELNKLQLLSARDCIYFSGTAKTETEIRRLPFNLRYDAALALVADVSTAYGATRISFHALRPEIPVRLRFAALTKDSMRVPQKDRATTYRPGALRLYRDMGSLFRSPRDSG